MENKKAYIQTNIYLIYFKTILIDKPVARVLKNITVGNQKHRHIWSSLFIFSLINCDRLVSTHSLAFRSYEIVFVDCVDSFDVNSSLYINLAVSYVMALVRITWIYLGCTLCIIIWIIFSPRLPSLEDAEERERWRFSLLVVGHDSSLLD